MTQILEPRAAAFAVRPVGGRIGAEIVGLDLRQPIDADVFAALRAEWLRHKVLFFRDQHLTHDEQIAFTRQFGPIVDPRGPDPLSDDDPPAVQAVSVKSFSKQYGVRRGSNGESEPEPDVRYRNLTADGRSSTTVQEDRWHADWSCTIEPPAATILRAVDVPAQGGDTHWTNMAAAYAGLPDPLQHFVDELWAEHTVSNGFTAPEPVAPDAPVRPVATSVHPVVRVHPETGEKALYVNPSFTRHILWLSPRQSSAILKLLFDHVTLAEYTTRFHWEPGDIAIWDNRSTIHLAAADYFETFRHRLLYRSMVAGDVPVGADGTSSRAIAGQALARL